MKKDYNRTICGFCLNKKKCEEYRNKFRCSECRESLVCTMKGTSHDKQCDLAITRWQDLPSKCLLVEQVMTNFTRNETGEGKHFIRSETDPFLMHCPRCMQQTFSTRPVHSWSVDKGRQSLYVGCCNICGVRVEISF
jgi:hypothetical protein